MNLIPPRIRPSRPRPVRKHGRPRTAAPAPKPAAARASAQPLPGSHWEIERKFLVRSLPPDLKLFLGTPIAQGYLNGDADAYEVRLRDENGHWFLTFKQGAGTVRRETEIELSGTQFAALWQLTRGRRILKTRFEILHPQGLVQLDLYAGRLRGLATAEMEFRSRAASRAFRPPAWFGAEITSDPRFKNRQLATRTRLAGLLPAVRARAAR